LPHVPLSHTSPAAHFLPQAPQLSLLEPVSTHCPAHIDKPSLQAMPHLPAAQTAEPPGPAGQTLPLAVKLKGTLRVDSAVAVLATRAMAARATGASTNFEKMDFIGETSSPVGSTLAMRANRVVKFPSRKRQFVFARKTMHDRRAG